MKTHKKQLTTYQRHVSTLNKMKRSEVAVLLALGYSNRCIRKAVDVTDNQIQSVVRTTNIRRKDYRDGMSPISQWVGAKARVFAQKYIEPRLLLQQ